MIKIRNFFHKVFKLQKNVSYPSPSCWPGARTDAKFLFPPSLDIKICNSTRTKKDSKVNSWLQIHVFPV
jgi:hypothetical protein